MSIERYTRPQYFADNAQFDRREYFISQSQTRDSDTLTRSNFRSTMKRLGGESETVFIVRDSHFLCGWVESIYIHESDSAALAIANEIADDLENYPVVSEDDWSELQWNEACEYWERMSVSDRVDVCKRFHITPFAARRSELPEDPQGGLIDYLTDGN